MKELKTGDYIVKNGQAMPIDKDIQTHAILLVSRDFDKIDLKRFEGCLLDVFNGHLDLEIKIYALKPLKRLNGKWVYN